MTTKRQQPVGRGIKHLQLSNNVSGLVLPGHGPAGIGDHVTPEDYGAEAYWFSETGRVLWRFNGREVILCQTSISMVELS